MTAQSEEPDTRCPEHHGRPDCPGCVASNEAGLAQMRERFAKINEAQRAINEQIAQQKPIQITSKLVVNDKMLAEAVNTRNVARKGYDPEIVRQVAAAGTYRRRWSWWRFTLTVR